MVTLKTNKMKKLLISLVVFMAFVCSASWLVAQTVLPKDSVFALPESGIAGYFLNAEVFIGFILLLTGWVTTNWITKVGTFLGIAYKQWVSYVISMALCFIGYSKGLGMFATLSLSDTIMDGVSFGLVANGVSTLPFVQAIMVFIKAKKAPVISKV